MENERVQNADIAALIENTLAMQAAVAPKQAAFEEKLKRKEARDKDESKMFRRFKIKDIVFLAIITACTFITSVVMPFIKDVPVFGIIQICLGLRIAVFDISGDRAYENKESGSIVVPIAVNGGFPCDDVSAYGADSALRFDSGRRGASDFSQL